MKLSNVIGFGISGVLCAGLLGACADGRGTNGFRSYQYSKEEMAQNKAKRDALKGPSDSGTKNTPVDDTNKGDIGLGKSEILAPDSGRGTGEPIFDPAPIGGEVSGDSARTQVITEQSPANPSAVPSQTASVEKLILTIDEELKESKVKENSVAKNLVKGITILPSGGMNVPRTLAIQALVVINGEEVVFDAAEVAVKMAVQGEKVPNFNFALLKPCEDNKPVIVKDLLQAVAVCRDANCLQIQVMLSFKTQGRPANAVFHVQPVKDEQGKVVWAYVATNIGKPKTFSEVQKACAPAVPAKPEGGATTAPAPTGSAPSSSPAADELINAEREAVQSAQEKKEREEADAKRREELKKEGFSCDDSPGEIARMKNARRAQEKAELEEADTKRCEELKKEGFSCDDSPGEIARMRNARRAQAEAQRTPFTGDGSEHTPDAY